MLRSCILSWSMFLLTENPVSTGALPWEKIREICRAKNFSSTSPFSLAPEDESLQTDLNFLLLSSKSSQTIL